MLFSTSDHTANHILTRIASLRRLLFCAGALVVIILVAGSQLVSVVRSQADRSARERLVGQVRLLADALDSSLIADLTGDKSDESHPSYRSLNRQLRQIVAYSDGFAFLYLMGRKPDGTVFIYVDSEDPSSADYSPPGDILDSAESEIHMAFLLEKDMVSGPVQDRWGTWVSAMVPLAGLRNASMGTIVLGADIDAADWDDKMEAVTRPIRALMIALRQAYGRAEKEMHVELGIAKG